MSYLLCLVDTNCLIHLRDIEVANRDIRLWLWDEFDVRISSSILGEMTDHSDLVRGGLSRKVQRSVWPFRVDVQRLEGVFLENFGIDLEDKRNQGERHNCCVALDAIIAGTYRQAVFVTDELHAVASDRNGFLFQIFDTYPLGLIWSSLDLIVFLYLRHRRFSFERAERAVITVNARLGGRSEVIKGRLIRYRQKLRRIRDSRRQMPQLWDPR